MSDTKLIEFWSSVPYLSDIEECRPRPAGKDIPSWWTKVRNDSGSNFPASNIKRCPGIGDFFTNGYTLPMWGDTILKHNPKTGEWNWRCGNNESPFHINIFDENAFLQYNEANTFGIPATKVFQLVNPWRVRTSPGYSILQIPLLYHFNKDFTVLPGIVDTDIYNTLNVEVMYHGAGDEVFIPQGTPLLQYIPFKRDDFELQVRDETEQDKENYWRQHRLYETSFKHVYRKQQRKRDEKAKCPIKFEED